MKPIRNAAIASLLTAISLAASAAPPPATAGSAADDTFFPIMAWNSAPKDPELLRRMHDCGLTVAGFVTPDNLDAVHAAGMKGIVSDPRCAGYDWAGPVDAAAARKNVESLVAQVGSHPAVFGYYLRDEPPASYFPALETVASVIREKDPDAWPYINLFPNYATPGQLAAKDYAEYLEKFIATCHPPILSYDNYSLLDNGALRDEYFTNLEAVRNASVKHHIPFWNIVLSCGHFSYRPPSDADLRFEAYTSLAYGARGISYFTYFCPAVGNYRAAPVDQFNHETPTWANLRLVNLQIQKLAPTLNHLTSQRVYHFSATPGCQTPPADSWVVSAGSPQFMAGEFVHDGDGSHYVMVVNKDVTHSAVVNLQLRTPPKDAVQIVSPYSGQLTPFVGEQVWLSPGAGVLLKI